MKWTQLAAGTAVALWATACLAEMPQWGGEQPSAMSLIGRGRLLGGQAWWTRYGEPVNAAQIAQDAPSKDMGMPGPAGPAPLYGGGYIFGPGSCDCPPPCIGQLWAGYFQNPLRCHPGHLFHKHCGACNDPCNAGGGHCGLFGLGHGCRSGGASCTSSVGCGCAAPVSCSATPSCGAVADCGCKPVCGKCRHCHLGGRWKALAAHWNRPCDSCSAPVGCGCATAVDVFVPEAEKQAGDAPPIPLPEEAALLPLPRVR
jgi:hypothetical protein